MARWFSDLFGRTGSDPADGESASPGPGQGGNRAGPPAEASDQTVRIERSKPANRLAWPARDVEGDAPSPRRGASYVTDRSHTENSHSAPDPHEEPTRLVGSNLDQQRSRRPPEARARPQPADEPEPHDVDEATRLVAPSRATDDDPVVGWLVVVAGPGRGRSLEIGPGVNSIGRAAGQKLWLNFGDVQISREAHASLIYDPRSHRFYLKNGEVRSLSYVDDEVVLAPVELKGGEIIGLGETRLRFVRLCDPDFNWS